MASETWTADNEAGGMDTGIDPADLAEGDLMRELTHLHETRNETFLHGAADALREHSARMFELEQEYLRRHPERDVDPRRTREGARGAGQHA